MRRPFIIIIIASVNLGLFLFFVPLWPTNGLVPHNLKWYHPIDLSNEANGPTGIHIANECVGIATMEPDGVYCYTSSGTRYLSIFDILLGVH